VDAPPRPRFHQRAALEGVQGAGPGPGGIVMKAFILENAMRLGRDPIDQSVTFHE
jgi:hypothetical protein